MDPELTALTSTAATTVVQLLTTSAWQHAQRTVGALWRRTYPERAETVQAELEEARTEVLAARRAGDNQAEQELEQELASEWQGRLRRLVAAYPQLAEDLRRMATELQSVLADAGPIAASTITLHATAVGGSRVNQAGRDLHVTED